MKIFFNPLLLIITTFSLFSCNSTSSEKISTSNSLTEHSCLVGNVKLSADFATGRMDFCKKTSPTEFSITLAPENTPINSSPWYAFKVEAEQTTPIKITMKVKGDKHRYPPKISLDGKHWQLLKHKLKNGRLVIKLNATPKAKLIAGQEIITNEDYVNWGQRLASQYPVTQSLLGKSTQNRSIYKLETNSNAKEWVVVLGRLHPPEVTGALALLPFVEYLLANNTLANDFRKKYNLLIIPNVNPDGVFAGNWRHNANGIDLNRDWINFSQVETQQIHAYLQSLVNKGDKIKFAIDFHSTQKDVFYTMPTDYGVEQPFLANHWLKALDKAMPSFDVIIERGNTPNNGVSKQYFADNYNVNAITYEMGDNTSRAKIREIANYASMTLMKTLLSHDNHNKE